MKKFVNNTMAIGCKVLLFVLLPMLSKAQCAMCTLNAENAVQNGNTQGLGLNDGILFLLAAPYLIALCVGILWYKRYRQKNETHISAKHDSIHLN